MSKAINIYQVFTRLFRNDNQTNKPFGAIEENGCSKYSHFTPFVLQSLKDFGITHIWFTGVIRHATCTSYENFGLPANNSLIVKGVAGSPYAITDYYDVDPDLADEPHNRMYEFESMIDRCHRIGLKVIIDFVPNHVARQYESKNLPTGLTNLGANDLCDHAFSPSNNFYYMPGQQFRVPDGINFPYTIGPDSYTEFPAKATGNDAFTAHPGINDWYETIKLNYGVDYQNNRLYHFDPIPDTWLKMLDIMNFWSQKGVDALRCDMAEMVPVDFWAWALPKVKSKNKEIIFIAEVYNPGEYSNFLAAGFDYLYDKVGLYDILRELIEGRGSTKNITLLWQRYEGYSHKMLRFLENHDEQRIASSQFAGNPWKAFPAMILAATLNTGPLMIYFGQEVGEKADDSEGYSGKDGRTTIFDYWCVKDYQKWVNGGRVNNDLLNEEQKQIRNFYLKLNHLRLGSKAIHSGSFYDLMWVNTNLLNQDKIYAFIRFQQEEVLLIVLNFDVNSACDIYLRIPADAFHSAGLSMEKELHGYELIDQRLKITFRPEDANNQGIPIHLAKNSGLVFKLNNPQIFM